MKDMLYLQALSGLFGWIYTSCWSLSFYLQPVKNYQRRSTAGTTVDFPALNLVGFVAYSVSSSAFLYAPRIRAEYARRHDGLAPTVRLNDVVFGAHAVLLCAVTLSQYVPGPWGFERRGRAARLSHAALGVLLLCVAGVTTAVLMVTRSEGGQGAELRRRPDASAPWEWIDVVYTVSYVKIVITMVKYIPQALLNYRNKSTQGWSIGMILLDAVGGLLSLAQLLLDSYMLGDWSGVTGNPVKLALGNISLMFDTIFMVQHYVLYGERKHELPMVAGEASPLVVGGIKDRRSD